MSWVVQRRPVGEVSGAPGWDIGMNTLPLGPTVTGLWMARGEMDWGEKPAGVVDLEELLRVTVKRVTVREWTHLLYILHSVALYFNKGLTGWWYGTQIIH